MGKTELKTKKNIFSGKKRKKIRENRTKKGKNDQKIIIKFFNFYFILIK
jgi:hypothetical protein